MKNGVKHRLLYRLRIEFCPIVNNLIIIIIFWNFVTQMRAYNLAPKTLQKTLKISVYFYLFLYGGYMQAFTVTKLTFIFLFKRESINRNKKFSSIIIDLEFFSNN